VINGPAVYSQPCFEVRVRSAPAILASL